MEWAWLIPVFSFAAVPLIVLLGKHLPGKGSPLAILAIAGGLAVFLVALVAFLQVWTSDAASHPESCRTSPSTGTLTCQYQRDWFQAGIPGSADDINLGVKLTWGILIDPLSLSMLGLILFVALMVQVYSLGYMRGDPRLDWYYAFHALFAASMLT